MSSSCRSCKAAIVWLKTGAGKNIPVDAETTSPDDQVFDSSRHVSHFKTCPNASAHSKTSKTPISRSTVDIPIEAAKRVAVEFGYDQVVIIARKVGVDGREHVTTYGVNKAHCEVAARMGDHFKHNVMGWPRT